MKPLNAKEISIISKIAFGSGRWQNLVQRYCRRILCFAITVILGISVMSTSSHALNQVTKFHHITIENGLSQSTVLCIYQDSKGFMWFGTQDGLNRFDGYNMKIYSHEPGDSTSLSGNHIEAICEDKYGNLWIGTWSSGLNRYDQERDQL